MRVTQLLYNLVLINSTYPNEQQSGGFIEQFLIDNDFSVKRQMVTDNRFNILAEKGTGPCLLIFGHLDTIGNQPGWQSNPFKVIKKGDKLFGLGAWDMKSGLAAQLAALESFNPNKFSLKIAYVVDEENVSLGMHTLVKSGWLKNVEFAITSEPGFIHGIQGISLGRIGRSVYKLTVNTEGGHIYLVEERENAIFELAKILSLLEKIKLNSHPNLGKSSIFPRFIKGGAHAMSIPNQIILEIEGQLVPPQTVQSLQNQIEKILNEAKKKGLFKANFTLEPVKRPTPFCRPYEVNKKSPYVGQITEILKKTINKQPIYYYRRSVGDENRIAEYGIPVLTIGPNGGNAHQSKEWVSESSLLLLEQFYRNLLTYFRI